MESAKLVITRAEPALVPFRMDAQDARIVPLVRLTELANVTPA